MHRMLGLGLVLGVLGLALSAQAGARVIVSFTGKAPAVKRLEMKADPYCTKHATTEPSVVVKNGRLQNVAVRVVKGATAQPAQGDVVIDQHYCMYQPRIIGATTGQTVVIKNSDATLHNVHSYVESQTLFNRAQPPGPVMIRQVLADKDAGRVIRLGCDVHAWMGAYVVVSDNPYHGITNADGTAELPTLPPGNYTVETWHERYGAKLTKITVSQDGLAEVKVAYTGQEPQPEL